MANPDWPINVNDAYTFGMKGATITPSATTDLAVIAKSVVMLSAGNLSIIPLGSSSSAATLDFVGLAAGQVVPYRVRRVTACSGTCASVD